MATMADGIAVAAPGELTLAHVRGLVDEVRTVTEEDLSRALLFCLERAKLVVEPAGVAAVAAVLADPAAFAPPVVAVVSGGNIDPVLLLKVVQHGMAAAGRYLSLRLRVPDRPGSLAAVLAELAAVGANVLEVEHERTSTRLHVGEVEVFVVLETRGPDHAAEVAAALARAGYPVTPDRRPGAGDARVRSAGPPGHGGGWASMSAVDAPPPCPPTTHCGAPRRCPSGCRRSAHHAEHCREALLAGMAEQRAEIAAIVGVRRAADVREHDRGAGAVRARC